MKNYRGQFLKCYEVKRYALMHCTSTRYSIHLQSFLLIPVAVSELCPGQISNSKSERRAITLKLCKAEFLFLCTTLKLIEIYLPTRFLVNTSCSLRDMSRTRCGGTLDGRRGNYMPPFGEHNNKV